MPSRFPRQLRYAIALAGICLAGAIAVSPSSGTTATTTKVTVKMVDYRFRLSTKTVHKGTVVFTVINRGQVPHIFEIQRLQKQTALLQPGQRATLRIRFAKVGRYYYLCPVGNHVLYGMAGYLRVTS